MRNEKSNTLPENFEELIAAGDVTALKAVFDSCTIDAREYHECGGKNTALHFKEVPAELVRWLVEQGLDMDISNADGRTPLCVHAVYGSDLVEVLLELGADVNTVAAKDHETPLARAARAHHTKTVEVLLRHGANPCIKGGLLRPYTPLESMLLCVSENNLATTAAVADIAKLLLRAGDSLTEEMQCSVWNIGIKHWRYCDYLSSVEQAEALDGLENLYRLFRVDPVPQRFVYDGTSPIPVPPCGWSFAFEALQEYLVPETGEPKTLQGEVIRAASVFKLICLSGGSELWLTEERKKRRAEYKQMGEALRHYLSSGKALPGAQLAELDELIRSIMIWPYEQEKLSRVCELAVEWVRKNKRPIPLEGNRYGG
jgi:hypothetical protein